MDNFVDACLDDAVASYRAGLDLTDADEVTVWAPMIPEVIAWAVPPNVVLKLIDSTLPAGAETFDIVVTRTFVIDDG